MAERQPGTEPRVRNLRESCTSCSLNDLCLPIALDTAGVEAPTASWNEDIPGAGKAVYRPGEPFHSVYAIHAGAMKSVTLAEDGEEQITAFHLAWVPAGTGRDRDRLRRELNCSSDGLSS